MQTTSAAYKTLLNSPDKVVADRLEVELPLWRTNLYPYPSAESNLGGWRAGATHTLTADSTVSYVGRFSLAVAIAHGAAATMMTATAVPMTWAGDSVAGSFRLRVTTALAGVVSVFWTFTDAAGATTGTSAASTYSGAVTSGWVQVGNIATVPAGTVTGTLSVTWANPGVGVTDHAWVDALLVERASALGTYFDGDLDETVNRWTNPRIDRDLHDLRQGTTAGATVTLGIDSAWSPDGAGGHSVSITPTGAGTDTFLSLGGDDGTLLHGITPNTPITVSATVNVPAALTGTLNAGAARIAVGVNTGAGPVLTYSAAGPTGGGTARLSVTVTPAAGATSVFVRLYHGGATGSGVVRWGDIRLVNNAAASSALWTRAVTRWDDIRLASTSRLNVAPYLDLTDALTAATVTRQIATDLPESVTLITGYPTAAGDFTLNGPLLEAELDETRNAYWLFNPHNTLSPIYGLDLTGAVIRHWAGLYTGAAWNGDPATPELLPTLTGTIDDLATDDATRNVTLHGLDGLNTLRGATPLPSFAYQRGASFPTNPGLLGGWCIDYLLRANGVHTSPPPRDRCAFYAGFNGSAWPDVYGRITSPIMGVQCSSDLFTDDATGAYPVGYPSDYFDVTVAGPWHPQCMRNPSLSYVPSAVGPVAFGTTGGGFTIEGEFRCDSTQDTTGLSPYIGLFDPTAGSCYLNADWTVGAATATLSLTTRRTATTVKSSLGIAISTDAWHHLCVQVVMTGSTTATVTVWLDYADTPTVVNLTGLPIGLIANANYTQTTWFGWLDSVQITADTTGQPTPKWAPMAYLDSSRNALYATVETTGQPPGQTIQALVAAELGYAGFDETGVFRFSNRDTLAALTSTRTSDAEVDLTGFGTQAQRSAISTHVRVPTAGWRQTRSNTDVYAATDAIQVTRFSTHTAQLVQSAPVLDPLNPDAGYAAGTHTVGLTQWRAAKTAGGSGPVSTGVAIGLRVLSPTVIELSITNANSFDVFMVSDTTSHGDGIAAGTPFLYIGGCPLTALTGSPVADAQWPPAGQGGATLNPAGDVLLTLPADPWRQDGTVAATLGQDVLAQLYKPRHLWRNVTVVGDPSTQLTDRRTVLDTEVGLNDDAYIFGVTFASSASDWSTALNLRAAAPPGAWILGVVGRSEMGQATYV